MHKKITFEKNLLKSIFISGIWLVFAAILLYLLIIMSHTGLKPIPNAKLPPNLHPNNLTVINLEEFQFLLNKDHCASSPVTFLFLIHSAPANWMAREAIRNSWGRWIFSLLSVWQLQNIILFFKNFQASNSWRGDCACLLAWPTRKSKPTSGDWKRSQERGRPGAGRLQGHLPPSCLQECHGETLGLRILSTGRICGEGGRRHVSKKWMPSPFSRFVDVFELLLLSRRAIEQQSRESFLLCCVWRHLAVLRWGECF